MPVGTFSYGFDETVLCFADCLLVAWAVGQIYGGVLSLVLELSAQIFSSVMMTFF
jgi:hypothetical protein